jgi:hypothetical protein
VNRLCDGRLRNEGSILVGGGNPSLLHGIQTKSGPQEPAIELVRRALSPRLNRPEHEADHSCPFNVEFKTQLSSFNCRVLHTTNVSVATNFLALLCVTASVKKEG